jgi:RNA polymerase sigma-70 factor (ECF subfamily)
MRTSADQIDLDCLHKAQQGCQESRSLLAERARGKVQAFINRMTLDRDLSEDLTQETLLELIKALPRLELCCEESFWAWVYRTALGKVQHHFRRQGARRMEHRTKVNSEILETMSGKHTGPVATLWRKEMVELILGAMSSLNVEYRAVLTLRCLEDQSYAQIAAVLGGSQMRSKMLFYRAKTALRKQLVRKGLRRSHFLGALTVFAAMTSTSTKSASAMSAITAASAKATVSGTVLGTLLSKAVLIGIAIVLALTGTTSILTSGNRPSPTGPAFVPWPGTGQPQFDNNMQFMGPQIGYTWPRPTEIAASHNPDQDGWRYFEHWPIEREVQVIARVQDKPNGMQILEQDHWIEYGIGAPLRDRPGAEIGLTLWHSGTLPSVYLTDGDQRLQEISVTHYRAGHAPGYLVLGFDLSGIAIDFTVRGIRIEGHDREGRFGGCGVGDIVVSLAPSPRR